MQKKLRLIRMITCVAFLIGILGSYKLWLTYRVFPLAPLVEGLSAPEVVHNLILLVLAASLLLLIFRLNAWVTLAFFLVLTLALVLDQNRLQPWVYFYSLILVFFYHPKNQPDPAFVLNAIRIILICMYLWSGLHKLNVSFLSIEFPQLVQDFFDGKYPSVFKLSKILAILVPLIEIIAGMLLIFPKRRLAGLVLAVCTHLFVLLLLSGIRHNPIVLPWNIALILLGYLVFFKNDTPINLSRWKNLALVFLVGIMPIFNLVNAWGDYLSWSLYSAKNKLFYVAIAEKHWKQFKYIEPALISQGDASNPYIIDVNKWSFQELNVPVNPEYRVFRGISKHFCQSDFLENELFFMVYEKPVNSKNLMRWSCGD
jgi:DoxX